MKPLIKFILPALFIVNSQSLSEIKKAKKIIEKSGFSTEQVRSMAKEKGYTDGQIDKVLNKNNTHLTDEVIIKEVLNVPIQNTQLVEPEVFDESVLRDKPINSEKVMNVRSHSSSYFGYDIFYQDPSIFQASSGGIVDPNYLIGPADEIIIMLWGETQFRHVLKVDKEGFIFIPEIGQVFVNGLNLNFLESKLFKVFSQSYASLNPLSRAPTTFLDVSLGNLRPLRIQVLGEVLQPGYYTIAQTTTLFSALYYFNGPAISGSLRDIHLIRNDEKIASIDYYDFLLTGKKPNDQKLQLDDIIFIPRRMNTISIKGEVNREGLYELKASETLSDLINISGGLKITAYLDRAQIDRVVSFELRKELQMDRIFIDVDLNNALTDKESFKIIDNDLIQVFSIYEERKNVVEISGAVSRPGIYDIKENLYISDLIENADGLLGDAYKSRAELIRIEPDLNEILINFDLSQAIKKDLNHDLILLPQDKIKIYQRSEMVSKKYVSISGHVKNPGKYLLRDGLTAYDLLFQGGGFLDEDFKNRTLLEKAHLLRKDDNEITETVFNFNLGELLKTENTEENFLLQSEDRLIVYQKGLLLSNKRVSIIGEVRNPGTYIYKNSMKLTDLIFEAGGINDDVFNWKVEINRYNNSSKKNKNIIESVIYETDNFKRNLEEDSLLTLEEFFLDQLNHISLQPNDAVFIRPDPFFKKLKKVKISGEVLHPGEYVILQPKEKLDQIIMRAGGLLESAYLQSSIFIRNNQNISLSIEGILKKPKSKNNVEVRDGDHIVINKKTQLVNITGQVNRPGFFKFIEGKRLKYYLKAAGGFKPQADKKNIWIEYPDGLSKEYRKNLFLSPMVMDGSVIYVGEKEKEEPFNKTDYFKDLSLILVNFIQAISIFFVINGGN